MTICLLAICLVCSGLLAGVYKLTKEPIEKASAAKNEAAIKDVLPPEVDKIGKEESIKFPKDTSDLSDSVTCTYNLAYDKKGITVGCAINVVAEGFGGPIKIKVGFKIDPTTGENVIWNTKVLSHAETPGLGAKCTEEKFAGQFKGLDPLKKKLAVTNNPKDTTDIDAITASTITSRAFVNGVATAVNALCAIARTPMLIDTATGASSSEWTAPTDQNDTTAVQNAAPVILNDSEGSKTK
jgi:electron transport complex protein RnfG